MDGKAFQEEGYIMGAKLELSHPFISGLCDFLENYQDRIVPFVLECGVSQKQSNIRWVDNLPIIRSNDQMLYHGMIIIWNWRTILFLG